MKKNTSILILLIIIGIICYYSFSYLWEENNTDSISDVTEKVSIQDKELKVTYIGGNMLDESLTFGNKFSKTIKIRNTNDSNVTFSIDMDNLTINNQLVTYDIYTSNEDIQTSYKELYKNNPLNNEAKIAYNLVVTPNTILYLRIDFKANFEESETTIKGILKIKTNLTDKEINIQQIEKIQSTLKDKLHGLNGINEKGLYIINVNNLNQDEYKGYILIDANDISDLKFYYSIYNDRYFLDKVEFNELKTNKLNTYEVEPLLDFNSVCSNYSKKPCSDFSNITYNEQGGINNFYNDSKTVVQKVISTFDKKEKNVYIYDVKNDIENNTNVRGYILINNTGNDPEYYLYLTNDLFMISGYNYSKLGDYTTESKTIRAYNETAFNLSSENMNKVCSFSGFTDCYTFNNEKVY